MKQYCIEFHGIRKKLFDMMSLENFSFIDLGDNKNGRLGSAFLSSPTFHHKRLFLSVLGTI
jgi:hypothetical protein